MVVHETVGVTKPVVAFVDKRKHFEKCLAVLVIFEHGFFIVAPTGDMINCAGVFYAQRTSHKSEFSRNLNKCPTVWT
jgi:hypothetical protein